MHCDLNLNNLVLHISVLYVNLCNGHVVVEEVGSQGDQESFVTVLKRGDTILTDPLSFS